MRDLAELSVKNHQPHRLHTQDRDWAETNCYVDIWIELLHALGHEPRACLPYTLAIDFEGDQWTFFKFPLSDIYRLYGLDVQELAVWQPLVNHIDKQVSLNKPVLVELDSFYLPDTHGSAYQIAHVKSTVAITRFDLKNRNMDYFHGQGFYRLDGDDFNSVFYLNKNDDPARLPPYVEIAKQKQTPRSDEVIHTSLNLLNQQLNMIPLDNPFHRFLEQFESDLKWLLDSDIEKFHAYSFATFRQFGACYELGASYLDWLTENNVGGLQKARDAVKSISEASKAYQFQLARSMARKKPIDTNPIKKMADSWDEAIRILRNTSFNR